LPLPLSLPLLFFLSFPNQKNVRHPERPKGVEGPAVAFAFALAVAVVVVVALAFVALAFLSVIPRESAVPRSNPHTPQPNP
jgi:hypothetical protein